MEFWTFSQVSDKIYTNYFPRVDINTKGYKKKNLVKSGLNSCKHHNWRKELYNPTIYKRSLQKRFHKFANNHCQIWWLTLRWHSVSNEIHKFCAKRCITSLSWWLYNSLDDLFSPWPSQRAFIHRQMRNTKNFQLSGWSWSHHNRRQYPLIVLTM